MWFMCNLGHSLDLYISCSALIHLYYTGVTAHFCRYCELTCVYRLRHMEQHVVACHVFEYMLCSSMQGFAHLKLFAAAGDSGKGVSYSLNTAIPDISFGSLHVYPEALGVNFSSSGDTDNYTWVNDYFIQPRAAQTAKLAKPLMIEEFGLTPAYGQANNVSNARLVPGHHWRVRNACCHMPLCQTSKQVLFQQLQLVLCCNLPWCAALLRCAALLFEHEALAHSLQICTLTAGQPLTPYTVASIHTKWHPVFVCLVCTGQWCSTLRSRLL